LKSEGLIVAEGVGFTKRRFHRVEWDWPKNFAGFEGIEGFGAKSVGLWRKSVAILFSVVTVKIEHRKDRT
jgi:hypothetical protein